MTDTAVTKYPANLYVDWALRVLDRPCIVTSVRSGAHSSVYKLVGEDESWFVKISDDLSIEIEKLKWLQGTELETPKLVAQNIIKTPQAILISGIPGCDLAELSVTQPKELIVNQLAESLKQFHGADASKCPFKAYIPGDKLVHGDACLPNFIYDNGKFAGYVDLMDMGVGDVEVDLSAAIWSLQFNLGPGYGHMFLEEYGHDVITDDEVARLYNMYETSPIFDR